MGWKTIKGREYYYKTTREYGRHRTKYVGSGEMAVLNSVLDGLDSKARAEEQEEARRWRSELLADEAEADEVFGRVETVFVGAMTAAGYWRPKRGPWRRRRMDTELATTGKPPRVPLTLREGKALGRKAEEGDKKARVGFREWLQNEGACYIDEIGSPQTMALENVVSMFANGHPACEESATEKLAKLHAALAGEHPSLLEVLLVQRVVYCWFVLWTLEDRQANGGYGFESTSSMTYLDRRISHANRRFLSSVKALAVFRKLDAATVLSVTQSVTESVTLTASSERTQQPSSSEKPR